MTTDYGEFVAHKLTRQPPTGMITVPDDLHPMLFPFQADLTRWALRRGRAAIFADTGLGKTLMQLEWAHQVALHTGRRILILAPLAVASQTVAMGERMGIAIGEARSQSDVRMPITITNYERLHRFDPSKFVGVVLDESSIIKHHDAKTLETLLEAFDGFAWKLCATATPAPNDYTELGTHAQFLGICSRSEMLSEYFTHDGGETQTWRLKKHATAPFWEWVASWAALVTKPSDLGYSDELYNLPPIEHFQHVMPADEAETRAMGRLFAVEALTLLERRQARKASVDARVEACADLVNDDRQPWVVWCDLNAESEALTKAIPSAVEVRGSQDIDEKERRLRGFADGQYRVIVTKPSIAGFGLNWQHAARMAFVGVTDSWEAYYQAVRRCWRFGQHYPVQVHVFTSEMEGAVIANLKRKEIDAANMARELAAMTATTVRQSVQGSVRSTNPYRPAQGMEVPAWMSSINA